MATASSNTQGAKEARPLKLAEVEHIEILGSKSIVCGFHLVDYIWADIFANLAPASTYVLIADINLARLYLDKYQDGFQAAWSHHKPGSKAPRLLAHILPPGETSKSRATKGAIEDWMLSQKCTRDTMVLALGGGVIGDLVGFVAATFMRGVPFVQIPTSLLAMVDSSIGGKTAVDTPAGKNLIGAFWQPKRIYMDMAILSTLPAREFSNGMAEVVKTAAIWTPEEFDILETSATEIRAAVLEGQQHSADAGLTLDTRSPAQSLLLRVIAASARVKAYVVTHDERESGMRGLLNFGHTIGHAIEAILSPQVLHGECVSIGCVLEAELARRMGHLGEVGVARLTRCLRAYGLPTSVSDPIICKLVGDRRIAEVRPRRLMDIMGLDKKTVGSQKRIVILKSLGKTLEMQPTNVDDALINEVISAGVLVSPVAESPAAAPNKSAAVVVVPPGSKSISNRALQLAALGTGECRIKNLLHSDDTQVMQAALQAMGGCTFAWEDDGDTLVVSGGGGKLHVPSDELYLGNAGTAARFLTTTVNLIDAGSDTEATTVLTGNARMKLRPSGPLVDALRANGCTVDYCEREGSLPLRVTHTGRRFPGGRIALAASVSSQYVSSILLCAPYAQAPVHLELIGGKVISQPYIDMTISMMAQFGCKVQRVAENEYLIPRGAYTNPKEYVVESDASSATYPLAFAAITGTQCTVPNIGSASLQGDARFAVDVLRPMGCAVEQTETSTTVRGPPRGKLCALGDIDMEPMTDAFLTAAVLAAVAPSGGGVTRIRGIANQHVKECDRIAAMCDELAKFGVKTKNHPDGIDVHGVSIGGLAQTVPSVHCYDDHRVAMSFSILACVSPRGAEIRERRCVGKTWPQWWDVLARDLGAPTAGSDPDAPQQAGGEAKSTAATEPAPAKASGSVVIIGMRGVGKTSLGTAAAQWLGLGFVDMDAYLEKEVGQTIPEIVNGSGWATFREHESRLLVKALTQDYATGHIIACGGGVVECEENRKVLKKHVAGGAIVVCMTPNMQQVAEYLNKDKTRPAYSATSDINDVYARRLPLYAECCNYEYLVDKELLAMNEEDKAGSWSIIERDFTRLLSFATGRDMNRVNIAHPSFFVSLTAPDVREYLPAKLAQLTAGSHAIELRADLLLRAPEFAGADLADVGTQDGFVHYVHRQFTILRHSSPLPVVFTVRTAPQGGAFPVKADQLRVRLLRCAVQWGAEYVDVEVDNAAAGIYASRQSSLVIASYHDVTGKRLRWNEAESEFANEILARARSCGDIAKLISVAHAWEDNLACQRFVQRNHSVSAPVIALNMGYAGQLSRVLCPCLTPVTHPLLTESAAPGQISVCQINEARALAGLLPSKQFFLFGTPIQHSPSPAMHNAGFAALGLPHVYALKETQTVDELRDTIGSPSFGGASVTIPHKQTIIPMLDSLTPAAQRIGAVNTIVPETDAQGKRVLVGDNTDYLGIVGCLRNAQLEKQSESFATACALVVGAGGTARAALYALHTLGVPRVAVFNRTTARAEALAQEFATLFTAVQAVDLRAAAEMRPTYIVGTIPASDLKLPDVLFCGASGVALDMAYKPRWTPLLEAAEKSGWKVVHGVAVLIEQGIHQLEKWTHSTAPVKVMGDAVYAKYDAEF
ncbi:3-dehydroquinate dehydratase (3-dehydroquinase) [Coemansia sp. RSA 1813]|nr:3-dehydroquinate dehydratase (3-dehydroquinase) [Coemansia sp. RSA 1646]KAJ1773411.1 3-dehydroquinate dehydratase (3-dehydroquinase) [Coemansia sp. RSA 1843]KAJ2091336.1 3-dehydroquinate dehydratase (3-dehydroquinase) [Coemansia sp. RSA 986]KAJ2216527.1 3-dehydroquinate dehydratase (3-dehydroquinase) [Coemansia sp. RSA 487]KAJ2571392.1 3-dehydroquinate dehydratase (3-dehydroquinase) [Coemansia sp. RSA 1813]